MWTARSRPTACRTLPHSVCFGRCPGPLALSGVSARADKSCMLGFLGRLFQTTGACPFVGVQCRFHLRWRIIMAFARSFRLAFAF